MKYIFSVIIFFLIVSCGNVTERKQHIRTVQSLKTGRIYEFIIHDLQKKDDIIKIADPWATMIDKKNGMVYDSVVVLDDAPKKD